VFAGGRSGLPLQQEVIDKGDSHQQEEDATACLSGRDTLRRRHAGHDHRDNPEDQHDGLVTEKGWRPNPERCWFDHDRKLRPEGISSVPLVRSSAGQQVYICWMGPGGGHPQFAGPSASYFAGVYTLL
jgi:hypothetical protein